MPPSRCLLASWTHTRLTTQLKGNFRSALFFCRTLGVTAKLIAVIRQFRDGMRLCVRSDDGKCSKPVNVTQALRQGCVLAPLLINMFFTAVPAIEETHFREDADVVNDLVRVKDKQDSVIRGR